MYVSFRKNLALIAAGVIFTLAAGCAFPVPVNKAVSTSIGNPTIRDLLQEPARYEGRQMTLSCVFKGWKGACRSAPPVSRSDWMIEDETGCLYVHGPLPYGLDPLQPREKKLVLTGVIKRGPSGQSYLELTKP